METQRKMGLASRGPIGSESQRCKVWVQDCWGHSSEELEQDITSRRGSCPHTLPQPTPAGCSLWVGLCLPHGSSCVESCFLCLPLGSCWGDLVVKQNCIYFHQKFFNTSNSFSETHLILKREGSQREGKERGREK